MNIEEFENKAYEIATANCLTTTFNKEQYDAYVNKFGYVLSGNKCGVGDARDNTTYIEVEY